MSPWSAASNAAGVASRSSPQDNQLRVLGNSGGHDVTQCKQMKNRGERSSGQSCGSMHRNVRRSLGLWTGKCHETAVGDFTAAQQSERLHPPAGPRHGACSRDRFSYTEKNHPAVPPMIRIRCRRKVLTPVDAKSFADHLPASIGRCEALAGGSRTSPRSPARRRVMCDTGITRRDRVGCAGPARRCRAS